MLKVHSSTGRHTTTFGSTAIDYVTLTTFSESAFKTVCAYVDMEHRRHDKFRGYTGYKAAGIRMLKGEQNGREHFIVIGEGNTSEWLIETVSHPSLTTQGVGLWEWFNCTRMDIQCSAIDNGVFFRALKDALANPLQGWRRSGPKPKITLIEGQGNQKGRGKTLYVGSRKTKNGYMTRIYQKQDDNGTPYIRFESELKGKMALELFTNVCTSGFDQVPRMLRKIYDTYPEEVVQGALREVGEAIGSQERYLVKEEPERSPEVKRAIWFKYDVAPSLCKIEDEEVIDWLETELVKVVLVLKRRRKLLEERRLAGEEASEALLAAEAQEEATMRAILSERRDESLARNALPVQANLFNVETLEAMLDAHLGTSANTYH